MGVGYRELGFLISMNPEVVETLARWNRDGFTPEAVLTLYVDQQTRKNYVYVERYRLTEKGQATIRRYHATEKYRDYQKRYSASRNGRERTARYLAGSRGQEYLRRRWRRYEDRYPDSPEYCKHRYDMLYIKRLPCTTCGEDDELRLQVDHVIPRAAGGSHDRENLQVLCVDCHKIKTAVDISAIASLRRGVLPGTDAAVRGADSD